MTYRCKPLVRNVVSALFMLATLPIMSAAFAADSSLPSQIDTAAAYQAYLKFGHSGQSTVASVAAMRPLYGGERTEMTGSECPEVDGGNQCHTAKG